MRILNGINSSSPMQMIDTRCNHHRIRASDLRWLSLVATNANFFAIDHVAALEMSGCAGYNLHFTVTYTCALSFKSRKR